MRCEGRAPTRLEKNRFSPNRYAYLRMAIHAQASCAQTHTHMKMHALIHLRLHMHKESMHNMRMCIPGTHARALGTMCSAPKSGCPDVHAHAHRHTLDIEWYSHLLL